MLGTRRATASCFLYYTENMAVWYLLGPPNPTERPYFRVNLKAAASVRQRR